jgi:hypothetical protein
MSVLPSLCVGARSESPTAQALFHVEDLPHLLFCAHAVEGGTVIIQQVCCLYDLTSSLGFLEPQSSGYPHGAVVALTTPETDCLHVPLLAATQVVHNVPQHV